MSPNATRNAACTVPHRFQITRVARNHIFN